MYCDEEGVGSGGLCYGAWIVDFVMLLSQRSCEEHSFVSMVLRHAPTMTDSTTPAQGSMTHAERSEADLKL